MAKRIRYAGARPRPAIPERPRPDKAERNRFYGSAIWRETRAEVLRNHPLCERCWQDGKAEEATVVHHKVERLEAPDLALDLDNLEALCEPCHTAHHKGRRPWFDDEPRLPRTPSNAPSRESQPASDPPPG